MSLRQKLILATTGVMAASLLLIGVVTVFFFRQQNKKYHQERLERKEKAIRTEMQYFSQTVQAQEMADVVMREFEEEVLRQSEVHRMDIALYNLEGQPMVHSTLNEATLKLTSRAVPPEIMHELKQRNRVVITETLPAGDVLSDFSVLRNADKKAIAILYLPYKPAAVAGQADVKGFLASISLTYLLLFLATTVLTVLLTSRLTANLRALGEKLETTDFNTGNEPIAWASRDEIGALVAAYNNMLDKLNQSREALARSERESAWREMAKQVAHEIKNPITPIKLSIQHLQATSNFDSPEWREKFRKTMTTILQQADSLTAIASEFSDFAKMPRLQLEACDVAAIVKDSAALFADAPIQIEIELPENLPLAQGDPDGLRRVMANLLKNAKQALAERTDGRVIIEAEASAGRILVHISDNGPGIPADASAQIFTPHFTTKSGGTGLGLSICKQIVESAGGTISFSSVPNVATRFSVELKAMV